MTESVLRFRAFALVIAVLASTACRAAYLGSYEAPDAGDRTSAGSGGGAGGLGGPGSGGGGGGSASDDASTEADARDAPDTASDVAGDAVAERVVDASAESSVDASADRGADRGPDANGDAVDASNIDATKTGDAEPDASVDAACPLATIPAPVADYSFDDCDDAKTMLRDRSPFAADALKVGGVRCAGGHSGIAVYFSGDDTTGNGYLTVPEASVPTFTRALTMSAWFSVWDTRYTNLLGRWFNADSFLLLSDGTNFVFSVALPDDAGGVGLDYHVTAPLVLYRWVHVVTVFDGASIAIYLDGKFVSSSPVEPSGALQSTSRQLQMGGLEGAGGYFKGLIDDVRLYDVALDANQVRALDCNP